MNIVRNDIDKCNATLTLTIEKQDYIEKVEKSLKEYRRKVQMPGFRPGNVPAGLVKKMYGKSILADEVNKIISESLYSYIKDNKIDTLGEPISNETEQKPIDFDTDETFEFVFDLGISPEIKIETTAKDKIPYYTISVTDEMIDSNINMHASRLGSYVQAEKSEEMSVVKGDMTEVVENQDDSTEPLKVVDAIISPKYIKDEKQKKAFIGKKVGAKIKFNPVTAMTNEYEVSSLLNIAKEKVQDYNHNFEYVVKEITNHVSAELDQSLFDKVMGEGVVKSAEEFRAKTKEGLAQAYIADSDYRFAIDAKEFFINKNQKAEFPVEFLKRWLKVSNEKITDEIIEKDFDKMLEQLKWDLVKRSFIEKYDIKIDDSHIKDAARQDTLMRFAQYGIANPQEEMIGYYVEEALKQKGAQEQFYQQAMEKEVVAKIKQTVTTTPKEITLEEFNKLFN